MASSGTFLAIPNAASAAGSYGNPFRSVSNLGQGRIDQGVDYSGAGPIYAIGDGVIDTIHNSGWPPIGTYISYKLTDGPAAGLTVYAAECITPSPTLSVGSRVSSGTQIGTMLGGSSCGGGIETGWADAPLPGETLARASGQWDGSDPTAFGVNFSQFLVFLGTEGGIIDGPVRGGLPANWPDVTLPTPTGLRVTNLRATSLFLNWNATPSAVAYQVTRTYHGAVMKTGVFSNATTFPDLGLDKGLGTNNGLLPGGTYTYTVTAFGSGGSSTVSAPLTVTTPPQVPNGLTVTNLHATSLFLNWSPTPGAASYQVTRIYNGVIMKTGVFSNATTFPDLGLDKGLGTDNGLIPGSTYTYKVTAFTGFGTGSSSTSAPRSVTTLALVPSGLVVTQATASSVVLSWAAAPGAHSYKVLQNGVAVASSAGSSATVAGLAPGTTYTFSVESINAAGALSSPSVAVAAKTLP